MTIKISIYEIIPYLAIGAIIGFSIGVASISSILYKKFEKKKRINQDNFIIKSREISFLDESEEEGEK